MEFFIFMVLWYSLGVFIMCFADSRILRQQRDRAYDIAEQANVAKGDILNIVVGDLKRRIHIKEQYIKELEKEKDGKFTYSWSDGKTRRIRVEGSDEQGT